MQWLHAPSDGILIAGPVAPFLPYIIGGAGALLHGIGSSQSKIGTSSGTSQSLQEGIRGPRQQRVFKQLGNALLDALNQGPTVSQSDRNYGRTNINNTWLGLQKNLESNLTSRGFGESGKLGAGFKGLEIGRANAFQNLESQLRNEAQARFERMLGLSQQYIQPTSFQTTGSTTGTQTIPGQGFLSGLGSGLGDVGSLLLLKSLLGGGGGGAAGQAAGSGLGSFAGGAIR